MRCTLEQFLQKSSWHAGHASDPACSAGLVVTALSEPARREPSTAQENSCRHKSVSPRNPLLLINQACPLPGCNQAHGPAEIRPTLMSAPVARPVGEMAAVLGAGACGKNG